MRRELLSHLPVITAVSEAQSFAGAAARLNMSPSAVSHAVRIVEDALGAPLFARTTRSIALTEAGATFLARVSPSLAAIDHAAQQMLAVRGKVTGVLRLNIPRVALPIAITPVITALAWRHPELTVEITSDDAMIDIVAGGYDAGVRLGEMIAEDMIAVRLTPPFKAIMVAAPGYIAAKGAPERVADLAAHACIGYRLIAANSVYPWDLMEAGRDISVTVGGPVRVTDSLYARDLALAGVGIAYLFEPLVRADIRSGHLKWILPEASIEEPGLFLYFPRGASAMPKLRAFIDVSREVLKLPGQ
jgi:DNA-binding transcriptional LysR family regulator